ncbi:MAG TPA: DHH family phosphoesterase [Firmicutes bacterium]|nr:DHH family phosphoesterase [Bacillota bacterium]
MQAEYRCRFGKDTSLEEIISKNAGQSVEELLHPERSPYISGLENAASLIRLHKEKGSEVTVIGDYDADGVLASAIMKMGLERFFGHPVRVRLPKRFSEGYGMNMAMVDEIRSGLVITVDNGIAAAEEVKRAKEKGLDVIVTDHHLPPANGILPDADVIVDPKATGRCGFDGYCGAGIAYRLVGCLVDDPQLLEKLVVFAGIATVADVVELHSDNRNLVNDSCRLLNARHATKGLNILTAYLGIEEVTESDYGFKIGPVINASGRLEDDGPSEVLELLTYDEVFFSPDMDREMCALADKLIKRNEERKEMVTSSLGRIHVNPTESPIVVFDELCSAGIIGIVAGKIAEQYNKPALVFCGTGDTVKGSGRSPGTINLKSMLDAASDLFIRYGGHAGAAGMTTYKKNLDSIQKQCANYLADKGLTGGTAHLYYDKEIRETDIPMILEELQQFRPFGQGNPQPVFKVGTFVLTERSGKYGRYMGSDNQHIKLFGEECDVVGFDMAAKWHGDRVIGVYGTLSYNVFNGFKRPQIEMTDITTYKKEDSSLKKVLSTLLTKKEI